MNDIVVCSFWVHRPKDYGKAADYRRMLQILDASCKRFGLRHVVLTDSVSSPLVEERGLTAFLTELPRPLMQAASEAQARWLESPYSKGVDSLFVGADCIIRQDFRGHVPPADLAVAYMIGHKKWRLNTGFLYVRAESREKVAPVFRLIADDTNPKMCDDMLAVERALVPMPPDFGVYERRGLDVAFVPLRQWNRTVKNKDNPASDAFVMHFKGGWDDGKKLFFDWAKQWGFDD